MLTSHPSFTRIPATDQLLRRYMNLEHFVWMLQNNALWFSRADSLLDRFEGELGKRNDEIVANGIGKEIPMYLGQRLGLKSEAKKLAFVNCWHMSSNESYGMWKIYGARGFGLAIEAEYQHFDQAILDEKEIFGSQIEYVDYETEVIPEGNLFDRFLRKRKGFSYEEEFRLATMSHGELDAEGVPLEVRGLPIKTDISKLVKAIRLAPGSSEFHMVVIKDLISKYGLDLRVEYSKLDTLY